MDELRFMLDIGSKQQPFISISHFLSPLDSHLECYLPNAWMISTYAECTTRNVSEWTRIHIFLLYPDPGSGISAPAYFYSVQYIMSILLIIFYSGLPGDDQVVRMEKLHHPLRGQCGTHATSGRGTAPSTFVRLE